MLSSYEAFLEGVKPATYVNLDIIVRPELIPNLMEYANFNESDNFWMFFRDEEMKTQFLNQYSNLSHNDPERERILGLTLGYPPKAVDFYTYYYEWQQREREEAKHWYFTHKVGMKYHGIMFTSHIDDLKENAQWLWDTYQIEEDTYIKVVRMPDRKREEFPVAFRNLADLVDAKEKVQRILDHNRVALEPIAPK
ncbi:hypothetical protein [Thermoflavimicrobium daqui]|uniref:Uncharacterized protein n=1 Tax=Thermoflavimicrobium daqui TaxID=2137476 RepID=A0A364K2B6_9BACL|nr:hypothetical protein [Thermoflavimicrobium daqui]RAL22560.1 hypothetical protein DL897_14205 [Thermoflavimicrobium daqui]